MTRHAKPFEKSLKELEEELRQVRNSKKYYTADHSERDSIQLDISNLKRIIKERRKE